MADSPQRHGLNAAITLPSSPPFPPPPSTPPQEDTALHWAAYSGSERAVVALLAAGAELDARGEYGNRPLHLAASRNHERIVSIMLQVGRGGAARAEERHHDGWAGGGSRG